MAGYRCFDKNIGSRMAAGLFVSLLGGSFLKNVVMRRRPDFDNSDGYVFSPVVQHCSSTDGSFAGRTDSLPGHKQRVEAAFQQRVPCIRWLCCPFRVCGALRHRLICNHWSISYGVQAHGQILPAGCLTLFFYGQSVNQIHLYVLSIDFRVFPENLAKFVFNDGVQNSI